MSEYQVTVTAPDGSTHDIRVPEEQVKYFMGGGMKNEFATAAYLAYCDLWVNG